ncbi:MAG: hypothetical protein AAFX05_01630, partial [Planctomycetota bacterium]
MIDPADAAFPVEQKEHEAQVAGLLRLLGSSPRRVVDIGAGAGRIADPLAGAGHDVLAIDHDEHALELCDDPVETRSIDVLDPEADDGVGIAARMREIDFGIEDIDTAGLDGVVAQFQCVLVVIDRQH